jgi:uncharacterized membrane protein
MKMLANLVGIGILFMVGFWLMATGFREIVASSSSVAQDILSFFAGVVCLVAGLIAGVFLLKSEYRM